MEYKITFEDGTEGYLEHFGVKGMHWGVWNAETRARYLGLHGARRGSGAGSSGGYGGLTDKQKKAVKIALASAAVVAVLGVGLYAAKKTGVLDDGILAVKNILQKNKPSPVTVADDFKPDIFKPDEFKPDVFKPDIFDPNSTTQKLTHPFEENLPKIHGKETMSESVKKANPLFGSWGHGDNCTRCSTALELRSRGFDVEATPMENGQHAMAIADAFKDARVHGGLYDSLSDKEYKALTKILGDPSLSESERVSALGKHLLTHPSTMFKMNKGAQAPSGFADYVAKCPEGARGNFIGISNATGGGHSMFWAKENGKLAIYDGQSGEKYHDAAKVLESYSSHQWIRTDNKEINWDVMSKQVRAHNPYYDSLPSNRKYTYQETGGYQTLPTIIGDITYDSPSGGYVSKQLARKFAKAEYA